MNTWMVRAGRGGKFADTFYGEGFVSIGWREVSNAGNKATREDMYSSFKLAYPAMKPNQVQVAAGQVFRFAHEFCVGDKVVTYDSATRNYYCGKLTGEYEYHPDSEEEEFVNRRNVEWEKTTPRDDLSDATRNTLGSTLTIFKLNDRVAAELWGEVSAGGTQLADSDIEPDVIAPDFDLIAHEAIKDRIASLDWEEMQALVAGLLRAMGYKTTVSGAGPDRGKDVVASPDGFGFQEPRIVVEVKHRAREKMGAPEIRSFLGGRHSRDKGLYVSTGGFTAEARYEADRASIPLTLMDSDMLLEAVLEHYESFDIETKQLLPLKPIYWPFD